MTKVIDYRNDDQGETYHYLEDVVIGVARIMGREHFDLVDIERDVLFKNLPKYAVNGNSEFEDLKTNDHTAVIIISTLDTNGNLNLKVRPAGGTVKRWIESWATTHPDVFNSGIVPEMARILEAIKTGVVPSIPMAPIAPAIGSPIENMFWEVVKERGEFNAEFLGMEREYEVKANGKAYRIDFAWPSDLVGIELDGYDFHSSRDVFTSDRERDFHLQMEGWRIAHFSGRQVKDDAANVVDKAVNYWNKFKRAP